jgi:hypothetical protein
MSKHPDNFVKWFKNPIRCLQKNIDAGFIVVMVSLPLLERYLCEKTGIFENPKLDERFYKEFVNLFPSAGNIDTVRTFWEIYRHGLLHQAALKTKAGIIQAAVHNAAQDLQVGYDVNGLVFTVSPIKFSDRVIEIIEKDFPTFEGASSSGHPPNRDFKFHKRRQLFICTHNEALTVAAMCVSNDDRSPVRIHGCVFVSLPSSKREGHNALASTNHENNHTRNRTHVFYRRTSKDCESLFCCLCCVRSTRRGI